MVMRGCSGLLSAFRSLQAGTNPGKVVILIPATATAPPRDTHLLSGGTGGLGLLTARWLAQGGVHALALASRSGAVAHDTAAERAQLLTTDVAMLVKRCDAAETAQV